MSQPVGLIWGAAGGIGQATLQLLNQQNFTTVGIARDTTTLDDVAAFAFEADVTNPNAIESAIYQTQMELDAPIDLVVYAVGDILQAKVGDLTASQLDQIVGANLTGAFLTTRAVLPLMADNGHLVFIGAVSERLQLPSLSVYAAAKAGLEAFAVTLGKEERKKRVTLLRPGAVDTPFWERVALRKPKDLATAEQIAGRIWDAYQTGQTGQIDVTH